MKRQVKKELKPVKLSRTYKLSKRSRLRQLLKGSNPLKRWKPLRLSRLRNQLS